MEIHNKEAHTSCYCYNNEDNSLVKIMEIKRGEVNKITLSSNEIVFIMEGKISCTFRNFSNEEFCKGQLLFLPAGGQFQYKASAVSSILILRLTDGANLCYNFNIRQLFQKVKTEKRPDGPFPLEINARLWHFADGLINTWQDGIKCKVFLRSKVSILLIMLSSYYSKDELSRFFYPMLSPDSTFSDFVRTNHIKYKTVSELATAMNITAQQFTRRFHTIFGQAPYEWMQQQKAQVIYGEILHGNKPLKEIAADYGFTDQANFNRFCRTFFETTPGRIRKNKS